MVRGTFSPARAWRPAVVARLPQTLGAQPISSCGVHANSRIQALALLHDTCCLRTLGASRRSTVVPWRPVLSLSVNNSRPASLVFPAALHRPSQAGSLSAHRHRRRHHHLWLTYRSSPLPAASSVRQQHSACVAGLSCSPSPSERGWFALGSQAAQASPPPVARMPLGFVHHRRLTPRSTGAPTASHQARAGGTRYIFTVPGLASCRRRPVTSNVRPHSPPFWRSNS